MPDDDDVTRYRNPVADADGPAPARAGEADRATAGPSTPEVSP
ncbi:hypothetical protein [Kineococcus esterisolvens]